MEKSTSTPQKEMDTNTEQENEKKRGALESPENQAQRKNTRTEIGEEEEKQLEEDLMIRMMNNETDLLEKSITEMDNGEDQWKVMKDNAMFKMVKIAIEQAVKEAIAPLTAKIEQIPDQIRRAVKEATEPLIEELKNLRSEGEQKEGAAKTTQPPKLMSQLFTQNSNQPQQRDAIRPATKTETATYPTEDYLMAKRSLGFYPITLNDIKRNQTNMNTQNTPNEHFTHSGQNIIRNFLAKELKMPEEEIERLDFKDVFLHQSGSIDNVLYVEFENKRDVMSIMSHAHNLTGNSQEDPRISRYVPRSLQPQYQALQAMAYNARKGTPKRSSKIWFAETLELRVRDIGDTTPWKEIKPVDNSTIPAKVTQGPQKQQDQNEMSP